MKISNPQRFFSELKDDVNYSAKKRLSTLMTRGDVIRKFCSFDSSIESDWHTSEKPDDIWVKFSYDAGFTYPLKFKFKDNFLVKHEVFTTTAVQDNQIVIDLSNYTTAMFDSAINGHISVYSRNAEGWISNMPEFAYKFDATNRNLLIKFSTDVPDDSENIVVMIQVDGSSAMALAVASPVYSSPVSAIPSIYDEELGVCNVLDEAIPQITCSSKFEDINRFSLKVVSADSNVVGKVKLSFSCNTTQWEETIDVTGTETWVSLTPPERLTGTMIITRLTSDPSDTLKDEDLVISLYITNIKVEIV